MSTVRLLQHGPQLRRRALVELAALREQAVELLQVFDGQPRGDPQPTVVEPGDVGGSSSPSYSSVISPDDLLGRMSSIVTTPAVPP